MLQYRKYINAVYKQTKYVYITKMSKNAKGHLE